MLYIDCLWGDIPYCWCHEGENLIVHCNHACLIVWEWGYLTVCSWRNSIISNMTKMHCILLISFFVFWILLFHIAKTSLPRNQSFLSAMSIDCCLRSNTEDVPYPIRLHHSPQHWFIAAECLRCVYQDFILITNVSLFDFSLMRNLNEWDETKLIYLCCLPSQCCNRKLLGGTNTLQKLGLLSAMTHISWTVLLLNIPIIQLQILLIIWIKS